MATTEKRVSVIENDLREIAYVQLKTETLLHALAEDSSVFKSGVKDFKDGVVTFQSEMKGFKDEMLAFKDEMKDFKDEVRGFKDGVVVFQNEMKDFKDEMLVFKDEMKDFKDEMLAFKDEMKDFKGEMLVFKDGVADFQDEMKDFKAEMGRLCAFFEQDIREIQASRIEMNKRWGELANKMGTVVEDIIAPGFAGVLRHYFHTQAEMLQIRVVKQHPVDRRREREFDLIALDQQCVFLNETKSNPRMNYVREFVDSLGEFFEFFPEYRGRRLVAIFSSLNMPQQAVSYLTEHGCYAMMMGDEHLQIVNFTAVRQAT